jgi:nitrogen fixation protein NifU and related proteins
MLEQVNSIFFDTPIFEVTFPLLVVGLVGAPACGDVMKLQIKIDDEGNIEEAKFKTFGCGSAIASRFALSLC